MLPGPPCGEGEEHQGPHTVVVIADEDVRKEGGVLRCSFGPTLEAMEGISVVTRDWPVQVRGSLRIRSPPQNVIVVLKARMRVEVPVHERQVVSLEVVLDNELPVGCRSCARRTSLW